MGTDERKLAAADALYSDLMQEITRLVDLNPDADSPEGRQLEWLSAAVEKYETTIFPIELDRHGN